MRISNKSATLFFEEAFIILYIQLKHNNVKNHNEAEEGIKPESSSDIQLWRFGVLQVFVPLQFVFDES